MDVKFLSLTGFVPSRPTTLRLLIRRVNYSPTPPLNLNTDHMQNFKGINTGNVITHQKNKINMLK
jgi:hypothetical protein